MDSFDDLCEALLEDVKLPETLIEKPERERWPHIIHIKSNYEKKSVYSIANFIVRLLEILRCETTLKESKKYVFSRNEDGTYSFAQFDITTTSDAYIIGFTEGYITFSSLYPILRLFSKLSLDYAISVDFISNQDAVHLFFEKIFLTSFKFEKDYFQKRWFNTIEHEMKNLDYSARFISKLMNLKTISGYKHLKCSGILNDYYIKKNLYVDKKKPDAEENFYWDGTPKMNNIEQTSNENFKIDYWTADMMIARDTTTTPMPKMIRIDKVQGCKIVSSNFFLLSKNFLVVVLEIQHLFDVYSYYVTVQWLTIDIHSYKQLCAMLENTIESCGQDVIDVIRIELINNGFNNE